MADADRVIAVCEAEWDLSQIRLQRVCKGGCSAAGDKADWISG
jgi:hypothetical protein